MYEKYDEEANEDIFYLTAVWQLWVLKIFVWKVWWWGKWRHFLPHCCMSQLWVLWYWYEKYEEEANEDIFTSLLYVTIMGIKVLVWKVWRGGKQRYFYLTAVRHSHTDESDGSSNLSIYHSGLLDLHTQGLSWT